MQSAFTIRLEPTTNIGVQLAGLVGECEDVLEETRFFEDEMRLRAWLKGCTSQSTGRIDVFDAIDQVGRDGW